MTDTNDLNSLLDSFNKSDEPETSEEIFNFELEGNGFLAGLVVLGVVFVSLSIFIIASHACGGL
jgi:hypothetical protein